MAARMSTVTRTHCHVVEDLFPETPSISICQNSGNSSDRILKIPTDQTCPCWRGGAYCSPDSIGPNPWYVSKPIKPGSVEENTATKVKAYVSALREATCNVHRTQAQVDEHRNSTSSSNVAPSNASPTINPRGVRLRDSPLITPDNVPGSHRKRHLSPDPVTGFPSAAAAALAAAMPEPPPLKPPQNLVHWYEVEALREAVRALWSSACVGEIVPENSRVLLVDSRLPLHTALRALIEYKRSFAVVVCEERDLLAGMFNSDDLIDLLIHGWLWSTDSGYVSRVSAAVSQFATVELLTSYAGKPTSDAAAGRKRSGCVTNAEEDTKRMIRHHRRRPLEERAAHGNSRPVTTALGLSGNHSDMPGYSVSDTSSKRTDLEGRCGSSGDETSDAGEATPDVLRFFVYVSQQHQDLISPFPPWFKLQLFEDARMTPETFRKLCQTVCCQRSQSRRSTRKTSASQYVPFPPPWLFSLGFWKRLRGYDPVSVAVSLSPYRPPVEAALLLLESRNCQVLIRNTQRNCPLASLSSYALVNHCLQHLRGTHSALDLWCIQDLGLGVPGDEIIAVTPSTPFFEVLEKLREHRFGSLPIIDKKTKAFRGFFNKSHLLVLAARILQYASTAPDAPDRQAASSDGGVRHLAESIGPDTVASSSSITATPGPLSPGLSADGDESTVSCMKATSAALASPAVQSVFLHRKAIGQLHACFVSQPALLLNDPLESVFLRYFSYDLAGTLPALHSLLLGPSDIIIRQTSRVEDTKAAAIPKKANEAQASSKQQHDCGEPDATVSVTETRAGAIINNETPMIYSENRSAPLQDLSASRTGAQPRGGEHGRYFDVPKMSPAVSPPPPLVPLAPTSRHAGEQPGVYPGPAATLPLNVVNRLICKGASSNVPLTQMLTSHGLSLHVAAPPVTNAPIYSPAVIDPDLRLKDAISHLSQTEERKIVIIDVETQRITRLISTGDILSFLVGHLCERGRFQT